MNTVNKILSITGIGVISILGINPSGSVVLAQIRGQDSQQFFDRGNQIMEQQIQQIEQENRQQIQGNKTEKENELETELEIKSPDNLEVKEVPDPSVQLEDNVPESPKEEIKIN